MRLERKTKAKAKAKAAISQQRHPLGVYHSLIDGLPLLHWFSLRALDAKPRELHFSTGLPPRDTHQSAAEKRTFSRLVYSASSQRRKTARDLSKPQERHIIHDVSVDQIRDAKAN